MVLRGNQIRPDSSLPAVKERLDRDISEYQQAVEQLAEPQKLFQLKAKLDATYRELEMTIKQLVCGGTAGAMARSFVAPVDRIKILMQTAYVQNQQDVFPSMSKTARHVVSTEGLQGLWRGNLTNCVRVVPHTAVQFVAYDKLKMWGTGSSEGKMTIAQRLLCGSASGVVAATITQPLDVIRIRLQTDPDCGGKVSVAVRQMAKEPGGWRNFYKGYTPAMLSLAPFIAVNFATFDTLKSLWCELILLPFND